jgi:hypothetical protein
MVIKMGIPGKIFTFFTSVLLLLATTNMVFGAHFCAGEIVTLYLYETNEAKCGNCDQDIKDPIHCSDNDAEICHDLCCSDLTVSEKAVDEMHQSTTKELASLFPVEIPVFLQQANSESAENSTAKPSVNNITALYVLPADRDIPVLVQSFLL